MAEAEEEDVVESDQRLLFMFQYVNKSMRLKVDRWHKMMSTDEYRSVVLEFLTQAECYRLVMSLGPSGALLPSLQLPPSLGKNKAVYFLKKDKVIITVDNIVSTLIYGDLSSNALDQMAMLLDQVYVPMLTSPANQTKWPKSVAEDVKKMALEINEVVYRVKGQVCGRTLLPMPIGVDRVQDEYAKLSASGNHFCDMELKYSIESCVIKWSNQLNEVLNETSASVFDKEVNPKPDADMNFWSSRRKNLQAIYEQLRDDKVMKMAMILEQTGSAYFPCYEKLFKNIVEALDEAREIDRYLTPITKYIKDIEETAFVDAEPLFVPLIHVVALIWTHCPYFATNSKLINLLKEICNLLIYESNKYLDPPTLFRGEFEETLPRVSKVITNLLSFKTIFNAYCKNLEQYVQKVNCKPWNFDPKLVFKIYDQYLHRIKLIEDLFQTSLEYIRLEKVEVGGHHGHDLSCRIDVILNDFNTLLNRFRSITFDLIDLNDNSFAAEYFTFKEQVLDFDYKLAAITVTAFDDCTNLEQLFKMIHVFGSLLERSVIKNEIDSKYISMINMFNEELNIVTEIVDKMHSKYKETGEIDIATTHWPVVSRSILFIRAMSARLSTPLQQINCFDHKCTKSEEAEEMKEKAMSLISFLAKFELELINKWVIKVPKNIENNLKKSLLTLNQANFLIVNFNKELTAALREVRYMKMLEVDGIPKEAIDLFERNEELHLWNATLKKTSEWYNKMRQRSRPQEFAIVSNEVEVIDALIKEIIEKNNWNSIDNWNFIIQLHDKVMALAERMCTSQENLQKIMELINKWNFEPLYSRPKGKKDALLVYNDMMAVHARYNDIIRVGQDIYNYIWLNFCLLHNVSIKSDGDQVEEVITDAEQQATETQMQDRRGSNGDFEGANSLKDEAEDDFDQSRLSEEESQSSALHSQPSLAEQSESKISNVDENDCHDNDDCVDNFESEDELIKNFDRPALRAQYLSETWRTIRENCMETVDSKSPVPLHPLQQKPYTEAEHGCVESVKPKKTKTKSKKKKELNQTTGNVDTQDRKVAFQKKINSKQAKTNDMTKSLPENWSSVMEAFTKSPTILQNWNDYLNLVDELIEDGLLHATAASLGLFIEEMNPRRLHAPIFDVHMKLIDGDIYFEPSFDDEKDNPNTLFGIMSLIITDIYGMCLLIPRIVDKPTYMDTIVANEDIAGMASDNMNRISLAAMKVRKFAKPYYEYSYLWQEEEDEHLREFLKFGRILTPEELELEDKTNDYGEKLLEEMEPSLEQFKDMIDSYEDLYRKIVEMDVKHIIDTWLIIDLSHFKQALLDLSSNWAMLYKQYLIDDVVYKLRELNAFIEEAEIGLQSQLNKGDYDGLVSVMGYLVRVKERQHATDIMFQPIRDAMDIIKNYGLDFEEEIYTLLSDVPDKWSLLKRIAIQVKSNASPLMQEESNTIRKRLAFFEVKQGLYKEQFKRKSFFKWSCTNPYEEIDICNGEVNNLEMECCKLCDQANLFEVCVPEFKLMKQIRKELKLAKMLWDYILVVRGWLHEWECTEWKKIDSEIMDMELKKFSKELRTLDKDMRNWEIYLQLEGIVKNMITALRAITELQNPAIRDRHWKQLMSATKVIYVWSKLATLCSCSDCQMLGEACQKGFAAYATGCSL